MWPMHYGAFSLGKKGKIIGNIIRLFMLNFLIHFYYFSNFPGAFGSTILVEKHKKVREENQPEIVNIFCLFSIQNYP